MSDPNSEAIQREVPQPIVLGRGAVWSLAALVVVAGWGLLAAWQWGEYSREREVWISNLESQGQAILSAMVGGIRGHRRMGQFFWGQVEAMLEEIASLPEVLAVGIAASDGSLELTAGEGLPRPVKEIPARTSWGERGVLFSRRFGLEAEVAGPVGPGPRRGEGRGPRWGQGPSGISPDQPERWSVLQGPVTVSGDYLAVLLLSRQAFDLQCRRALWTRAGIAGLGGLLLGVSAIAVVAVLERERISASRRVLEVQLRHQELLAAAAAGLAHETRNPLNIIRMRVQTLAETLPENQANIVAAILEECDRVTTRINQFLAFARPPLQHLGTVDCEVLIEELRAVLDPDLREKQLCLRWEISPSSRFIQADRELLRQILFNLLSNAIAFSPPSEVVEVRILPDGPKSWRIEVHDRGPGVPEANREHLFRPYFSTRPGGTGLGLAIVARICEVCGWKVGYQSRAEGGTCFYIVGPYEPAKGEDSFGRR
jgi:signal transduction histidine kinase